MNENNSTKRMEISKQVLFLLIVHSIIFLLTDRKINSTEHNSIISSLALNWTDIEAGRYTGLISYMFLHSGINHFINNMLMLYAVGEMTEKKLRVPRFLIVYFLSGIGGGLLSSFYYMKKSQPVYTIGASAAVFGIIGSAAALLLKNNRHERVDMRRILFLILISLYGGFTATNVDNAGHIGGLVTGFLTTLVIVPKIKDND